MLATDTMLRLPNALVKRGAKVDFVDKWGDRGVAGLPMAPKIYGLMIHWIVSKKNGKPKQTLGVVTNGHSTLAGPLANLHQDWDGSFTIVAGGRANHGGLGVWRGVSGNQFWIAVECEGPPFEQVQIDELAKLVAAVADVTGQNPEDWAIDHARYAPSRKIDCKIYIEEIRRKGIALYRGTNTPSESTENPAPTPPPAPKPVPKPTLLEELLMAVSEKDLEEHIKTTKQLVNLLQIKDQNFGWPQHTYNAVVSLQKKVGESEEAVIREINNFLRAGTEKYGWPEAIYRLVLGLSSGQPVDIDALAPQLVKIVGPEVAKELGRLLSAV